MEFEVSLWMLRSSYEAQWCHTVVSECSLFRATWTPRRHMAMSVEAHDLVEPQSFY